MEQKTESESDWIEVSYKKHKANKATQNNKNYQNNKNNKINQNNKNNQDNKINQNKQETIKKKLSIDDYEIIDVRNKYFESVPKLQPNYTSLVAIDCPFIVVDGHIVKEKPILVKQYENYSTPLTFDLMKVGNYYITRDTPEYWDADVENIVSQCIGKEVDVDGVQWVTYQMISDQDDYLECKYIVTRTQEFEPRRFRRLPHDFWINYEKYENHINKEFYIDHVALTGIY